MEILDNIFANSKDLKGVEISKEDFDLLLSNNLVIDGKKGGLLLGESHVDLTSEILNGEGILLVRKIGEKFVVEKELEGFEYLLNGCACCNPDFNYEQYNEPEKDLKNFSEYCPSEKITVIDLRLENPGRIKSKILFIANPDSFALINRGSTQKYLKTLDDENKAWEPGCY